MEEKKEFLEPEVVSYDREELALETGLTGNGDSDLQAPTGPTP
jgi:hypothetical protein